MDYFTVVIIKLLLLSVLLFSNVSIFADTCLDNNLSNAEYLKNACIKNIDAWKASKFIVILYFFDAHSLVFMS
jgi:hypothetical protein